MFNNESTSSMQTKEKAVLRFEKSKKVSTLTNDEIIGLFRQAFLFIPEVMLPNRLSLASSNQYHGVIAGVDYLFFDIDKEFFSDTINLTTKLNKALGESLIITDLVSIESLDSPYINKFAYYVADFSRFSLPPSFNDNLTILMTRDTNMEGEYISVTETIYRRKGNRKNPIQKKHYLLELIPHIHYVPIEKKLYFIADGNTSAFILLAGLLYGKCHYSEEFSSQILSQVTLSRLDYLKSHQKIQHSMRNYDNVLGDYISTC